MNGPYPKVILDSAQKLPAKEIFDILVVELGLEATSTPDVEPEVAEVA